MPIDYSGPMAVFTGTCAPEEADALLEWLRRTPDASADLAACGDLHTALAQLLLAARVRLAPPPADPVLAACLKSALPAQPIVLPAEPEPIVTPKKPVRRSRSAAKLSANIKVPL
jgi:hypothetical protein